MSEIVRVAVERLAPPEPRTSDWCADATASAGTSAAGVVGIAVFVAAVWIVTSVGSFDRTQTPAVPGPAQTGPAETDYLLDLDTGVMTPLPKSIGGDGSNEYAASPDGSRLAYIGQGDNGEQQIFVANLDGTGIEQVTHDLEAAFSPAWSPDGSKIAYIGYHDGGDLFVLDLFVLDICDGDAHAAHVLDVGTGSRSQNVEGQPAFVHARWVVHRIRRQ